MQFLTQDGFESIILKLEGVKLKKQNLDVYMLKDSISKVPVAENRVSDQPVENSAQFHKATIT